MLDISIFEQLGLNKKEARVYLASLELGPSTIAKIAQKAGIKRTTLNEFIQEIVNKGLLVASVSGKRRLYSAISPADLEMLIDKQKEIIQQIKPELDLLASKMPQKPKIRFYEGEEGIKAVYADTIKEGKEILAFTAVSVGYNSPVIDYLTKQYVQQRSAKKILAKVIAPDSAPAKEYKKRDEQEYRQTKLIPENDYPFSIELNIYGNKVAFISYKPNELLGVIIESKEIARTMGLIHKFFWVKTK